MQLGFLGALGGAARAGSDVMDERIRSAAEQKRLDTINQFTIDAEGRANTEYAIRKETEIRQKYGQGAIDNPSGYLAGERESEARARFGDEANLALGTDPLTRKGAMDDWTEQQKAAVGFHRQRDDNTVAAQGKWTQENHPERGWGEVNSTTGQWRPLSPGAGSVHGKSAEGSGGPLGAPGTKVPKSVFTDIRADYAHRINPGDMALAAAASEGDEAFMRYIEQTGQLGSLYEFAAKPPYGIDLRTGTYLDMNAQTQQGPESGLVGGNQGAAQPQRLTQGHVVDGYEYMGGDPNQQSSWRKAE